MMDIEDENAAAADEGSLENDITDEMSRSLSPTNKAIKITFSDDHFKAVQVLVPIPVVVGDCKFFTVNVLDVEQRCNEFGAIAEVVQSHSDLIAGKYEGGLKIWEGSVDLCKYLMDHNVDFESKKVLELGCGAGIPGLYALQKGGNVHFQDFNAEVLNFMTIPNTLLSTPENLRAKLKDRCKFYAGDWASVLPLLKPECEEEADKYDFILSSETIYNPRHHTQLYSIMKSVLKETGTIYLAAKFYYFGVGGGISQFEDIVKIDGTFESNSCWTTDEGVKRVILQLKRKRSD